MSDIRGFFGGGGGKPSASKASSSTPTKAKQSSSSTSKTSPTKKVSKDNEKQSEQTITSDEKVTVGTATWSIGESVPYAALVDTFEAVSAIGGRLDKESLFRTLFVAVIKSKPTELDYVVHLASNSLGPAYEGLELGIGDALLIKAICEGILKALLY